jgi:hypothetical protein
MYGSKTPSGYRRLPHLAATAALAIAALLIAAQPAAAAKDPIGGGETSLVLNKKIAKALAKAGVPVKPKGSAETTAKGVAFPVTGGKVFSGKPSGKVEHDGGKLRLGKGKSAITFADPLINLSSGKLKVAVGRANLKLFNLSYGRTTISRDGFATEYRNVRAKLSKRLRPRRPQGHRVRPRQRHRRAGDDHCPGRQGHHPGTRRRSDSGDPR